MSSGDLLMFLENEKTLNKIKEIIDKLFKKDPKGFLLSFFLSFFLPSFLHSFIPSLLPSFLSLSLIHRTITPSATACDGGVFIDVCRCEADAESIERLKRVVSIFAVTTLIVIDDGFLHKRLEDVFSERKDINIILLPKLDGVWILFYF